MLGDAEQRFVGVMPCVTTVIEAVPVTVMAQGLAAGRAMRSIIICIIDCIISMRFSIIW